jgi:hypothetical protein
LAAQETGGTEVSGVFAEVLAELLVDGEYFGEYLRPLQPAETLGTCAT